MEGVESQIAEWRGYGASAPGVNGHDVGELEDHLRHQIAELSAAGLSADEGFLIAVKRLGEAEAPGRQPARAPAGRRGARARARGGALGGRPPAGGAAEPERASSGWVTTLAFAVAAAVAVQVAR